MRKTIDRLKEKYGLSWLRHRMVYKRHANLHEKLLADASKKVNDGIQEIIKLPKKTCTCPKTHLVNGKCMYGKHCRTKCAIYRLKCKCCGDFYDGKTQRAVKTRTQEHYRDLGKFFEKKRKFNQSLEVLESELASIASSSPCTLGQNTPASSRRMTRSQSATQTPSCAAPSPSGMSHLLRLFSASKPTQKETPRQLASRLTNQTPSSIYLNTQQSTQPTIPEDSELDSLRELTRTYRLQTTPNSPNIENLNPNQEITVPPDSPFSHSTSSSQPSLITQFSTSDLADRVSYAEPSSRAL